MFILILDECQGENRTIPSEECWILQNSKDMKETKFIMCLLSKWKPFQGFQKLNPNFMIFFGIQMKTFVFKKVSNKSYGSRVMKDFKKPRLENFMKG
jgi:hypothetical protein